MGKAGLDVLQLTQVDVIPVTVELLLPQEGHPLYGVVRYLAVEQARIQRAPVGVVSLVV